ncbi:MAG: TIGR03960 family B12-binding radical SAM protein [Aphanocapsa feldmannii 288cV]|nr:MAG: TIGR03960 family B12-binding radical SAM protein [Aphanocapsa feldmannii 288cV]
MAQAPALPSGRLADPVPFADLVDRHIIKPGRYLGNELGAVHKDWNRAEVRWALTYPELYEVGASNLGHIILYGILNQLPGQLCDRAYLPGPDLAQRLRSTGTPLFAVESRRRLSAFDILGFSLSYELGATNILEMLDLIGLPIWARQRPDLPLDHPEAQPLVFAGGQTATSNPEPYADFFDFIALGDGEELLPEIGLVVRQAKAAGLGRRALLLDLAQVPGVYVPSLYGPGPDGVMVPLVPQAPTRVLRRVADPMPHYAMALVPHVETVHDRLTVEIRRGCTRGCRFCQPGMLTRPARDVEPEAVVEAVETGMRRTGYSDFSLLSLSCSDYLALPAVGVELRNRLRDHNVSLNLPSQRVDRFDETIAHILGGTRRTGITFAPEAGTQRLRDIINKGLSDAELLRGVRTAYAEGWRKIKLYFMVGLPGETDADVVGIAETVRRLQRDCSGKGRLELNLTISNFTPKPHTPFQWHAVSSEAFAAKHALLRQALKDIRGLKVNITDPRISAMEDVVGRGDRSLAAVIAAAWRNGAGMDAWWENVERASGAWTQAIEAAGLNRTDRRRWACAGNRFDPAEPVGSSAEPEAGDPTLRPLPWDHIDSGVDKQWLRQDLQRALAAAVVPDCSFSGCSSCGVCGPAFGHNVVVSPPAVPGKVEQRGPAWNRAQRLRLRFTKEGDAALFSHLDLMRLLDRALRRATLPVSFSNGFHPMPRIQVGLALPLGVEGGDELLDLELTEPLEPAVLLERLQPQLPAGMTLLGVEEVPPGSPSLSRQLRGASWSLGMVTTDPARPVAPHRWVEAVAAVLASDSLIWDDTDKRGRPRTRDLRPLLLSLRLKRADAREAQLTLKARIDALGRSLKPEQLAHWLSERLGEPLQLTDLRRDCLHLHSPGGCEATPGDPPD